MATMHPRQFPQERAAMPRFEAERRVWDALRTQMGEDVHVFYNVAFLDHAPDRASRDAEADFVIVDPANGVMCLEVKGGAIEYDPETGRFTSTDRAGDSHPIRSPKDQAKRVKYYLLEALPRALSSWGDPPWVLICTAVCLPDAYRAGDQFPDIDPQETIYFEDLDRLQFVIPAIFDFHRGAKPKKTHGASVLKAAEQILEPPTRVGSPTTVRVTNAESALFELTADQVRVLRGLRFARRFALAGGPGTGKTVIAFEQAKWLASQGFKTLFTCFNRLLADRLAENAKHISILEVMTFHRLARETFGDSAFDEKDNLQFTTEPNRNYEAIVVDEAQNFHNEWWVVLDSMLADKTSKLNVFYDPNQEIYDGTNAFPSVFGDGHDGIAPKGWYGFLLTDNVRNTSPIISATNRVSDRYKLPDNGVDGEQVILIPTDEKDIAKEVGAEIQRIVESGVPAREIAVLCAWSSDAIEPFIAKLKPQTKAHLSRDPGDSVLVETVRRFQGLDASVVILVGLDAVQQNAGAMLVAMTRARSRLAIVASHALCARIDPNRLGGTAVEFREL